MPRNRRESSEFGTINFNIGAVTGPSYVQSFLAFWSTLVLENSRPHAFSSIVQQSSLTGFLASCFFTHSGAVVLQNSRLHAFPPNKLQLNVVLTFRLKDYILSIRL